MIHFNQADKGGDGQLSFEDFAHTLEYLGLGNVSQEEAKKIFEEADTDKSGEIDVPEFVELVIRMKFPDKYSKLKK